MGEVLQLSSATALGLIGKPWEAIRPLRPVIFLSLVTTFSIFLLPVTIFLSNLSALSLWK